MRILFLASYFPPEIGSGSRYAFETAQAMVRFGHEVTVVTGFPSYHLPETPPKYRGKLWFHELMDGIRVIRVVSQPLTRQSRIARGLAHSLAAPFMFAGGLLSGPQDVVYVDSPPFPVPLNFAVVLLAKAKAAPLVVRVDDIFPQTAIDLGLLRNSVLTRGFRALADFIYRRATFIVVHCSGSRDYLLAHSAATPEKVVVIPNWIDPKQLYSTETHNSFRAEQGLGDEFVVLFAGTIGLSQGLGTVIDCAARLRDCQDILFLLVGDGVEKPRLEQRVQELELANVRFLPMQPQSRYPQVVEAANICLVTLDARVTTPVVPGKIPSIMASGRPIIGCMNLEGDAAKLIRDAECGYCVAPDQPERLAEAVLDLYHHSQLCERFGQNGRFYAEKHLDKAVCTRLYESLFAKAMEHRDGGRMPTASPEAWGVEQ